MKKIFFLFFCLVLLINCAQNAALLGPTIAVGSTGNVYQASLSYGVNKSIEEETGKTPVEHVSEYVEIKGKEKKKKTNDFKSFRKPHQNNKTKVVIK